MSEYLDRKQVIELYEKYQPSLATHVYEFGEKLKALPIVKEETSRPHGEWEHWGSPFSDDSIANSIVCSLCKARYVEIEDEVFNFCPNCGADMRDKKDDLIEIIEAVQSIKEGET